MSRILKNVTMCCFLGYRPRLQFQGDYDEIWITPWILAKYAVGVIGDWLMEYQFENSVWIENWISWEEPASLSLFVLHLLFHTFHIYIKTKFIHKLYRNEKGYIQIYMESINKYVVKKWQGNIVLPDN